MLNTLLRPFAHRIPESNRLERIWVMAKSDFLQRYYGSALGLFWAFLNPVFQFVVYYLVFTIVFAPKIEDFALFLFLGLILYLFFVEGGQKGLNLIRTKKHILENIPIPISDIYFSGFLSVFMGFIFNILVFLIASFIFGAQISIYGLLLPIILLPLFLFTAGTMIILSIISAFLEDIQHIWDIARLCILWLSGVFYPIDPSAGWKWALLAYSSPVPAVLYNSREVLIYGGVPDWSYLFYSLVYSSIFFGLAWLLAARVGRLVVEKV